MTYLEAIESANIARLAGDYSASEKALGIALLVQPDDPEALRLLALVQAYQDKLAEALSTITRAASAAPNDIDIRLARARIFGWNDNFAGAESLVDQIVAEAPNYVDAWTLKGRLAYYQGELPRSLEAFERAHALQPDSLDGFLGIGDVLQAQGKFDDARDYYRSAAELYPDSTEIQDRLSRMAGNDSRLWRIDFDGEYSSLGRTILADWNQQAVRVERKISNKGRIAGGVERAHRFGIADWLFKAGGLTGSPIGRARI